MALGTPIETDSQVRLRTWRRHWLYNPGEKDTAKQVAKRKAQSCTMPKREDGNVGEESAIKKSEKNFQLFSARVSEYPISGVFTVL